MVDLFIVFSLFTRGYSWGCPIFRLIWWFTFALQPWSMDLVLGTLMLTFPNEDPHISLFPLLVNISHSNLAIYIIYRWCFTKDDVPWPIGSMYGIYANIGGILMVNVTIYSIHGSYGWFLTSSKGWFSSSSLFGSCRWRAPTLWPSHHYNAHRRKPPFRPARRELAMAIGDFVKCGYPNSWLMYDPSVNGWFLRVLPWGNLQMMMMMMMLMMMTIRMPKNKEHR